MPRPLKLHRSTEKMRNGIIHNQHVTENGEYIMSHPDPTFDPEDLRHEDDDAASPVVDPYPSEQEAIDEELRGKAERRASSTVVASSHRDSRKGVMR